MGKGRLQPQFLERTEQFCDRCVALAEQLLTDGRFSRIADQLAGSGSSVGANMAEANEAMSVKDFRKCLGIAIKELAETGFWIRLIVRRRWVAETRVQGLLVELQEIRLIVGSILARTARTKTPP